MLSAAADHLWQSLLFCALGGTLVILARDKSAGIRLWAWRLCAVKFLVPFSLLFALGGWLGLPGRYSGEPEPAMLARIAAAITPWLAPLQTAVVSHARALAALVAALLATAVCARLIAYALRIEGARLQIEQAHGDPADPPPPPPLGFAKAVLFTSCALLALWVPLLGGAIADRNWRNGLLLENVRALREAPVEIAEAAPGMGDRMRVLARSDGVLIRNINVRELIAVSNGVTPFAVWSNQFYENEDEGRHSWFLTPRYDVRVYARIREPDEFDAFALRQRITRLLVERFGLEINVNGECQPPCGRWDPRRDDRPL
jgi:hypothetical protein